MSDQKTVPDADITNIISFTSYQMSFTQQPPDLLQVSRASFARMRLISVIPTLVVKEAALQKGKALPANVQMGE